MKEKNEVASHVPEFRHRHSYLVSLLFAAPIPTLVIFMKFLPLVYIHQLPFNKNSNKARKFYELLITSF